MGAQRPKPQAADVSQGLWSMAEATFIAINSEALLAKSKVYMSRAMASKGDEELDEYQLWASLALELLGKAALATKHPSLIVDPTHWPSMFVAAGIKITTDVKTITAKTLFERLTHLAPRFDKSVQDFCVTNRYFCDSWADFVVNLVTRNETRTALVNFPVSP